jgi:hypothetical protein
MYSLLPHKGLWRWLSLFLWFILNLNSFFRFVFHIIYLQTLNKYLLQFQRTFLL